MLNIAQMLDESAKRQTKRIALVDAGKKINYQELQSQANKIANGLNKIGIGKGDKVALSCPNITAFAVIYYGILKTGAVVVPLNILLKGAEIAYHLQDSQASCYFCFEGTADLPLLEYGAEGFAQAAQCKHLVIIPSSNQSPHIKNNITIDEFSKDCADSYETVLCNEIDSAILLYTSGTTGRAKGADLSHSNIFWNTRITVDLFGSNHEDRMLTVLPLFHSFGQTCLMNASTLCGATNYLMARFDNEAVLDLMADEKITVFAGVPTMYWGMLNAEDKPARTKAIKNNIRKFISGGAANPVEIIKGIKARFDLPVYEGFGLSECAPVVTFNPPGKEPKVGSVGTAVWGMEVIVADQQGKPVPSGERGEIICRGHSVMKAYYNKPAETAEALKDGWFHTGDIGIQDEDGYFYIVDRAKDLIVRGGFNVYPREVEEVILQHEAISLVAVIGIEDQKYGEEVKACVVLAEGKSINENDLIAWCKENMGSHKYPRSIQFLKTLPTNATGKILKRELRS